MGRDLYYILGDIVANLHGSNLRRSYQMPLPKMLLHIIDIEDRLSAWKASLPDILTLEPWISPYEPSTHSNAVATRLIVISKLRYLSTRLLLHRPILSNFLQLDTDRDEGSAWDVDSFTMDSARRSIAVCYACATEIIDIIHALSNTPALLPAWWFSLHYSKLLSLQLPQISRPLTQHQHSTSRWLLMAAHSCKFPTARLLRLRERHVPHHCCRTALWKQNSSSKRPS